VDVQAASGVTFHDGSPFNADAVVWNVEKCSSRMRRNSIRASRRDRVADADAGFGPQDRRHDGELTTKEPDSFLPITSPTCSWRAPRNGRSCSMPPKARMQGEIASAWRVRACRVRHRAVEVVELHAASGWS